MSLAERIAKIAATALQQDAVIISAADIIDGKITKVQLYFFDENEAAMDVIKRHELLEAAPDFIYIINLEAKCEKDLLLQVGVVELNDELYFKLDPDDTTACDQIGNLPGIAYLEAIELISNLKN